MIADFFGWLLIDVLFLPLEGAIERIWRLHRREPAWHRWVGGALLVLLSALVVAAYVAAFFGAAYVFYWLIERAT